MTSSLGEPPVVPDQWGCLLVVAGPGYGKTTALRRLLPPARHTWADHDTVRRAATGQPPDPAPAGTDAARRWLVLDDVPALDPTSGERLLRWAAALPERMALAVGSRHPFPVRASRWSGRGGLRVLQPGDLALSRTETVAVLRDDFDLRDIDLAAAVHTVTGGWPALVRFASESLAGHTLAAHAGAPPPALTAALARPSTVVAQYITDEVLAALSVTARNLTRDLATFDPVAPDLCRALGQRGAARSFDELVAAGVVQPFRGAYRVVPIVAAVAARGLRPNRAASLARLAAAWYEEHGPPTSAARALLGGGDAGNAARLLAAHAPQILASGGAAEFVSLVDEMPASARTPALRLHWGDALRMISEVARARVVFGELAGECSHQDGLPPGLAWRIGRVPYLLGEPHAALAAFAEAGKPGDDPVDDVLLLSWTASAHWMLGEARAATEHAVAALRAAQELGQDGVLAEAHTVVALALKLSGDADTADAHYAQALRHARAAGDVVQASRILANQSHEHLARARYPDALATARAAATMAEQAGPAGTVVVALCNEAEALNRLGRFDESIERYTRVMAICQRLGLRRAAAALVGLADVHRRRGWRERARAAYEQALTIARDSRQVHALVPALTGLARVLVQDDPAAAARAVAEAEQHAGESTAPVWVARGWLCLGQGDGDAARRAAGEAVQAARYQPAMLADALELRAAAETNPAAVRAALAEAGHIWLECGASLDADRIAATVGSLPDASTEERLAGSLARQRQAEAGVQHTAAAVPLVLHTGGQTVRIRVLGRFEVRVADRAVATSAWQSRKARDLLRILVARRGRAVPREELADLLWPGERDASRHRLSVLLSIVRNTLDPDRVHGSDRFVIADKSGIALDPTWLRVDVEEFLDAVAYGVRLYEQGDGAQSRSALAAAVKAYPGEPFDDDPYPDWTASLREQARAAHLRAQRTLARLARRAGDTDEAVHRLLVLLDLDPYDEDAHRSIVAALVAAGRHGEARRAQQRYQAAMAELGVLAH